MKKIELINLKLLYDKRGIHGLRNVNLEFNRSHVTALVGPSGAGKTTLLNALSNDLKIDSGQILIRENKIIKLGQIFQFEPSKNVLDTLLAYSIQPHHLSLEGIRYWLDFFDLTNEIENPLASLSAGQKQRVHLISALIQGPDFLLLDEPFGHLDETLRYEISQLLFPELKSKNIGVIWVSHDFKNAFSFSDRMVIMNYGEVQQVASPEEIYFHPANLFVAQFTGRTNVIVGEKINQQKIKTLFGEIEVSNSKENFLNFLVRPENILETDEGNGIRAKKIKTFFEGQSYLHLLEVGEQEILMRTTKNVEEVVFITLERDKIHFLPAL